MKDREPEVDSRAPTFVTLSNVVEINGNLESI
jgi:hypothetical protein